MEMCWNASLSGSALYSFYTDWGWAKPEKKPSQKLCRAQPSGEASRKKWARNLITGLKGHSVIIQLDRKNSLDMQKALQREVCFEVQFEVEFNVEFEVVQTVLNFDTYPNPSKGGFDVYKGFVYGGFVTKNPTTAGFTGQKNGGFSTACSPPDQNVFDMDQVSVTSLPALTYISYPIPMLAQIYLLLFFHSFIHLQVEFLGGSMDKKGTVKQRQENRAQMLKEPNMSADLLWGYMKNRQLFESMYPTIEVSYMDNGNILFEYFMYDSGFHLDLLS